MNDRRFNPSQAYPLNVSERQIWLLSAEVLCALGICAGNIVADIGAGTGHVSVPLARAVGTRGKVDAIAAQAGMLTLLQRKLGNRAKLNSDLTQADAEATNLQFVCCTVAFFNKVWHEFNDRRAVLDEARWILSPGGRIAVLDWRPDVEHDAGPPLEHRLRAIDFQEELNLVGFSQTFVANVGQYSGLVQGKMLP